MFIIKSAVWSLPLKQQTHHTLSLSLQSGLYHWNSKHITHLSLSLQSGLYHWNSKHITRLSPSLYSGFYHWNSKHIACLSLCLQSSQGLRPVNTQIQIRLHFQKNCHIFRKVSAFSVLSHRPQREAAILAVCRRFGNRRLHYSLCRTQICISTGTLVPSMLWHFFH